MIIYVAKGGRPCGILEWCEPNFIKIKSHLMKKSSGQVGRKALKCFVIF